MACRRAPELLHDVNPDARLIFLLRNPVERAFSHYMHVCRTYPGAEPYSFSEAIRIEPERIRDDVVALDRDKDHDDATFRAFSYVARGMYGEQLERWLAVFPRENVLVCESERFFERPDEVVNDVADFLGLPATSSTNVSEPYNVGGYSSRFSAADRDYLTAIYAEDRAKLQALLGGNFGDRWF